MNCNSCGRSYDEHESNNEMPFCDKCYIKWDNAYKTCMAHSGITPGKTDDPRFATSSDTYTIAANTQVQQCLASLVTRDPVYEESLDVFRRKQYKKLNKFDISKIEASL